MRVPAVLPAMLAVLAVAGCSNTSPAEAEKPATVGISGTLTIRGGESEHGAHGELCEMSGGYTDIREGAQVVITDEAGTAIAVGRLGQGGVHRPDGAAYPSRRCVFPFEVSAPAGRPFYGVEVSHRGRLQYTAAQVASPLELTLDGG